MPPSVAHAASRVPTRGIGAHRRGMLLRRQPWAESRRPAWPSYSVRSTCAGASEVLVRDDDSDGVLRTVRQSESGLPIVSVASGIPVWVVPVVPVVTVASSCDENSTPSAVPGSPSAA
jgi:hypothetical protein